MKFYLNENKSLNVLQNYLTEKNCNLFLVQAEYVKPGTADNFSNFSGIDLALKLNSDECPVLLCSFMPESYFLSIKDFSAKFHALMGKKRTGFIDIINPPEEFYKKYLELVNDKKEEDLLALELNRIKEYENTMISIRHVVYGRISNYKDLQAIAYINQAREIGVTGTDEEVFKQILDFKHDAKNNKFVGKYFPGIFCDLEGTLLVDNDVNFELLEKLKKLELTKPITLWTAGDIEEYQKKLISNNIPWKLVSKLDFFGTEVEIAYDDLSYENFNSEFGIKVREFNQVVFDCFDEEMRLKLEFLHSLLTNLGISNMIMNQKFSSILNMDIKSKKIDDYIKEIKEKNNGDERNKIIVVLRDFLLN